MAELTLTRREIFGKSWATAIALLLPYRAEAQKPNQDPFKRTSPISADLLREYILESSRTKTPLPQTELTKLESMIRAQHFSGSYKPKLLKYEHINWVKFDNDPGFVEGLKIEATRSIDDLFSFLNRSYLHRPKLDFEMPRRPEDINFTNPNVMYFVAASGIVYEAFFEVETPQGKIILPFRRHNQFKGHVTRSFVPEQKGDKTYLLTKEHPIFYGTASDKFSLIGAPAAEALHRAISLYSRDNVARDYNLQPYGDSYLQQAVRKNQVLEEKFVHALCFLWLRNYIKGRNLMPDRDVEREFQKYEGNEIYQGVNVL